MKVAVSSQLLAPAGIILDAELTLATPERLWLVCILRPMQRYRFIMVHRLSTGIRALDHAVGRSAGERHITISAHGDVLLRAAACEDNIKETAVVSMAIQLQHFQVLQTLGVGKQMSRSRHSQPGHWG